MKTNNKDNTNLGWNFDNTYVNLPEILYSKQEPIPVKLSKLIIFNRSLSDSLGLNSRNLESNKGAEIFAGSRIPEGSTPIAQAYAGHQFGHFTKLGDGRAVLLGEHVTPKGKRFDIQLKGSGRTRYSRGGDGRAAIGPMLREYIMSEAIHNLGIPTTRSLAVVTTGGKIIRESHLPGAILTRVASSHIRVGTFQYLSVFADNETLREFADYTIQRHYPNLATEGDKYLLFLKEVVKNQAKLISKWQLVGFIHGVMNTDNMTISGETIDYGPCAFMDKYNLSTVFSSIDRAGRYAYGNQPQIAAWNLARFSETLLPLLNDNEDRAIELATNEVSEFYKLYNGYWLEGMKKKLGLVGKKHEDEKLIEDLLNIMEKYQVDYTNTFRELTLGELDGMDIFKTKEFSEWKLDWEKRLSNQKNSEEDVKQLMKDNNPAVIPRNHRVEEALEAAYQGDLRVMESLLKVLENPYAYSHEQVEYSKLPPTTSVPYRTFCGT